MLAAIQTTPTSHTSISARAKMTVSPGAEAASVLLQDSSNNGDNKVTTTTKQPSSSIDASTAITCNAQDERDKKPDNRSEISRPVVFQCSSCRTIVADSTDLVDRRADLRWVIFACQHGNVRISPDWLFSNDGSTYGCLYNPLHCSKCDTVIGVTFHTTNAAIEALRGKFILFTSTLLVYELNFDDLELERQLREQLGHLLDNGSAASSISSAASTPPTIAKDVTSEQQTIKRLQQEIGKLQKFCLALHERCTKLEQQQPQLKQSETNINSSRPLANMDNKLLLPVPSPSHISNCNSSTSNISNCNNIGSNANNNNGALPSPARQTGNINPSDDAKPTMQQTSPTTPVSAPKRKLGRPPRAKPPTSMDY